MGNGANRLNVGQHPGRPAQAPLARSPSPAAPNEAEADSCSRLRLVNPIQVLIIDDDECDRRQVRRILERSSHAFRVHEARSAREALDRLDVGDIDCVVLDFHLPEASAAQLIDRAYQLHGERLPLIVVVTGDESQWVAAESIRHGAIEILSKKELADAHLPELLQDGVTTRRRLLHADSQRWAAFSRLVGATAHNINNPATIAKLSLEAIREELCENPDSAGDVSSRVKEFVDAIDESLDRITHAVKSLGNELGTSVGYMTSLKLGDVVQAAVDESGAPERCTLELGSSAVISGNASQLKRAFYELIVNALEASPESQSIIISTWDDRRFVNLVVDDAGPGLTRAEMSQIFTPLYTTRSARGALGMGLARAAGIMRLHDGTLGVEQSPFGGARFQARLHRGAAPSMAATPRRASKIELSPRILLLDDEPLLRKHYSRLLSDQFEVHLAASIDEAYEQLSCHEFHVILCDVSLGKESGADFIRALMQDKPAQARRTIFMSGGITDEAAARFVQSWPGGWLQKPVTPARLIQRIREFVSDGGSVEH